MDVDATVAVRSVFWTDARSRMDYKLYGEIISFDTTYSTNKYNMPFAPIIGSNGNGKTIFLDGLYCKIREQKLSSGCFKVLLKSWGERSQS
jgi:hypothetical protein